VRIFPTPPYSNIPELLDSAGEASPQDLRETLRDIRRANIFGLGTWVVKHHLENLVQNVPMDKTLRLLDLATGSADIPEELCRWSRSRGRKVEIVATDISPEILAVARRRISKAGFGHIISFTACDAVAPPFADKSFDVALCSLAFHHLDRQQAEHTIREMDRVSRVGFIINDIYRSQGAWLMAAALSRLTTANRLTRHDGPASVYRAFTPRELVRMARNAGVGVTLCRHPFWRVALIKATFGEVACDH
jgi:ubiquinone/menaquinone biosynthesis C-methylase UbiE